MKAYVLGIADRFRGAELVRKCMELGYEVVQVPAIDGSKWSDVDFEAQYDSGKAEVVCGRALAKSEVACARGHLAMYEQMVADGESWALFLEDDAVLHSEVLSITRSLPLLPERSIVTLRHENVESMVYVPLLPMRGPFRRLISPPMGASAYFMNRSAAQFAVAKSRAERVHSAPDWPIEWSTSAKFWATEKPISEHTYDDSQLSPARSTAVDRFVAPWGDAGVAARIRWTLRLWRAGVPGTIACKFAFLLPMFSRLTRVVHQS